MVHYADLLADLEAQMRRVAAFTELEVAEDAWLHLVAAARFDAMKQDAIRNAEHIGLIFEGGASRFFYKGTNGRWRDVLSEEDLALYETAAAQLDPDLRAWLEAAAAPTRHSSGCG
jgi:aryl sulfotransferase